MLIFEYRVTRGIPFVFTAWCVIGRTDEIQNKHSMLKYITTQLRHLIYPKYS